VHPNDHVNAVAVVQRRVPVLDPPRRDPGGQRRSAARPCPTLPEALTAKAQEWADVVKAGRTHLMDATPVTLGQEFSGYAAQVSYGVERLTASLGRLAELPLGGTAVGTGINTRPGSPRRSSRGCARAPGCRSPRPATTSRHRAPGTRWWRRAVSCVPSRLVFTRLPTTSAGWARVRGPACANCTSPICSRARASCPARSIRWCASPCGRCARRSSATTRRSRSRAARATSSST
jgi:hypothetical protein